MGCSYDVINVTIDKKKNIKTFVEIFNSELEEELYWGSDSFISEEDFEENADGTYTIGVDSEPLFTMMENGEQLFDVIFKYLETVPNCDFSAWYECTFNNCGAIVHTTYEYHDGILTIEYRSSENSYLDYCENCEWDACDDEDCEDDAICTIDKWQPDKEYVCPNCGAVLEWDVCIEKTIHKMIDGVLIEINTEE